MRMSLLRLWRERGKRTTKHLSKGTTGGLLATGIAENVGGEQVRNRCRCCRCLGAGCANGISADCSAARGSGEETQAQKTQGAPGRTRCKGRTEGKGRERRICLDERGTA